MVTETSNDHRSNMGQMWFCDYRYALRIGMTEEQAEDYADMMYFYGY